ncbi:hypothetical protein SELMODRAFT_132552 [Selaginella moellendorffii]|uniref:Cytochrome c oxidase assembly protein COX16 n=1 Tax=Selaginella moellendorffii TaxID=88036 RepID=D8T5W6_SELML|nr:hypothetical protein SELMODRAFT_132552 [Selaginella moellendorffii]
MSTVRGIQKGRRLSGSNRFFLFGLPIIAGSVIGYVGIAQIVAGRTEVVHERDERDWELLKVTQALSKEGILKNFKQRKPTTLEEELKAIQQHVDINNFEYKKVPRPGEKADK